MPALLVRAAASADAAEIAAIYNEGIADRCVYSGVGEHGVYVARAARGHGVGRRLLDELCLAAEAAGLYKLTSRIFADNESSIAAHTAAGFDVVGVQRRHGRLDGEWKDCVLVERHIGDAAASA